MWLVLELDSLSEPTWIDLCTEAPKKGPKMVVEEAAVEDKDAEQSEFMDVKEKESMKKRWEEYGGRNVC